jgi:hypothetical protein
VCVYCFNLRDGGTGRDGTGWDVLCQISKDAYLGVQIDMQTLSRLGKLGDLISSLINPSSSLFHAASLNYVVNRLNS